MKLIRRLLLATLLPVAAFAQVELLTNGNFASGTFGNNSLDTVGGGTATITGWNYLDVGHTGGTYYFPSTNLNATFGAAPNGGTALIFTSGGAEPGNGLYQNFTATNGELYTASIYARYVGSSGQSSITFLVQDADNSLATVQSSTIAPGALTGTSSWNGLGWTQYSFTFTAPSSNLRFSFYDSTASNPGSSADAEFYGASVVSAVPEPSTYAALAGCAALGLVAWRRRRAAA